MATRVIYYVYNLEEEPNPPTRYFHISPPHVLPSLPRFSYTRLHIFPLNISSSKPPQSLFFSKTSSYTMANSSLTLLSLITLLLFTLLPPSLSQGPTSSVQHFATSSPPPPPSPTPSPTPSHAHSPTPPPPPSDIDSPTPSPSSSNGDDDAPSPSPSHARSPTPLPPSDIDSPTPSPTSPDDDTTPSPSSGKKDKYHGVSADVEGTEEEGGGDGGLRGGQKAGIAVGVIASVCVVGLGALVYKKRKENMDRVRFGYVARSDFL